MTSNGVALDYLIQSFYDKTTTFNNYVFTIDLVIIILGIAILFVVSLFVWRPYVENLNNNIWRTKGMLSMIPIQVILENEGLKKAMTNSQLMQAVK
jgi:ABC-type bacteriocin/lantibiotic exporter with double-glycine peptidase domain